MIFATPVSLKVSACALWALGMFASAWISSHPVRPSMTSVRIFVSLSSCTSIHRRHSIWM